MRTLRLELGHHLGHRYDSSLYQWDGAYRYLMRAINDMWARQTLADFLKTLNLKYDIRALRQIMESDPNTDYDKLISRMRRIWPRAWMTPRWRLWRQDSISRFRRLIIRRRSGPQYAPKSLTSTSTGGPTWDRSLLKMPQRSI